MGHDEDKEKGKPLILAVDDAQENLDMLTSILSADYEVIAKSSGREALDYLHNTYRLPRVILLDIKMPGVDGYRVMEAMQADTRLDKIPIIIITGNSSERMALELGAADYIAKPFHPGSIKKRIHNQIMLHSHMDSLEQKVLQQVERITSFSAKFVEFMADVIECRNLESGKHVKRTVALYDVLVNDLLDNSSYSDELVALGPSNLIRSVPLHDIGKIGIPDNVLMKPGKLTTEEFEVMKRHTTIGKELIETMMREFDEESFDLHHCRDIAFEHHERFDGTGYPNGLSGQNICLSARIMAVVDVYDAMVNNRVYKAATTHNAAMGLIIQGAGTHFDPVIASSAQCIQEKFISIEHCDGTPRLSA